MYLLFHDISIIIFLSSFNHSVLFSNLASQEYVINYMKNLIISIFIFLIHYNIFLNLSLSLNIALELQIY